MLARMNFASALAANQRFRLATAKPYAQTSDAAVVGARRPHTAARQLRATELANYMVATGPWTGADAQLQAKVPGSCISSLDPRINSYENHQAPVHAGRRRGVHGHVRGA
jgi:hypothetical protein